MIVGGPVVYIVWRYVDCIDSVWTAREGAQARYEQLQQEYGDKHPSYEMIHLNQPCAWGATYETQ